MSKKKKYALPPLDHEYGYFSATLKVFLDQHGLTEKFDRWFLGQTCMLDEKTGNIVIYHWDVTDFLAGRQPLD